VEKKKGNINVVDSGGKFYCAYTAELLPKEPAEKIEKNQQKDG